MRGEQGIWVLFKRLLCMPKARVILRSAQSVCMCQSPDLRSQPHIGTSVTDNPTASSKLMHFDTKPPKKGDARQRAARKDVAFVPMDSPSLKRLRGLPVQHAIHAGVEPASITPVTSSSAWKSAASKWASRPEFVLLAFGLAQPGRSFEQHPFTKEKRMRLQEAVWAPSTKGRQHDSQRTDLLCSDLLAVALQEGCPGWEQRMRCY
ncbi:hypothetical protein L1887_58581 [Cichorium endivia]|nr:hypothetical protein L1887_58581 [Cichorium endivia]